MSEISDSRAWTRLSRSASFSVKPPSIAAGPVIMRCNATRPSSETLRRAVGVIARLEQFELLLGEAEADHLFPAVGIEHGGSTGAGRIIAPTLATRLTRIDLFLANSRQGARTFGQGDGAGVHAIGDGASPFAVDFDGDGTLQQADGDD
jgi:hypothetical protein